MNFIIQSKKIKDITVPYDDFCTAVIQTSNYRDDIKAFLDIDYYQHPSICDENKPSNLNIVPIGTVEFVHNYIFSHFGKKYIPEPLNIPQELYKYLGRTYYIGNKETIPSNKILFVKSATQVKGFKELIYNPTFLPDDTYVISELINILSEHRVFVHKGEIIDIRVYNNDFKTLPDLNIIKNIINDFINPPIAYTIDVAVTDKGETVIIELHNFYSCGLYGMQDFEKATIMMSQWYCEHMRIKCKN